VQAFIDLYHEQGVFIMQQKHYKVSYMTRNSTSPATTSVTAGSKAEAKALFLKSHPTATKIVAIYEV